MTTQCSNQKDHGFVLLAGAGLGSFIWRRVIPNLQAPALAIDLPGRGGRPRPEGHVGMEACAQAARLEIEAMPVERVIIVGHSVSGVLALRLPALLKDKAVAVVMVGAGVPENGRAYVDLLPLGTRLALKLLFTFKRDGMKPPAGVIEKALCNGLDPETTSEVVSGMVAEFPCLFLEPLRWQGLPAALRRGYVVLTDDRSDLKPEMQREMAVRFGAESIDEIHCGHLPMLSHPRELAAILNKQLVSEAEDLCAVHPPSRQGANHQTFVLNR